MRAYYEALKSNVKKYQSGGNTLPAVSENKDGEKVILSEGRDGSGLDFIRVKTLQNNGWIRVNDYYEDGSTYETFER